MKRPFAYVCSPYQSDTKVNIKRARDYCRKVYEAGFAPICPHLLFTQFLTEAIPEERKDGLDMANQMLRRCRLLIVCGDEITEGMQSEILYAKRLNLPATTLDGILTVQRQGKPYTDAFLC